MKVALTTLLGSDLELLDPYLGFHRRIGVDVVVVDDAAVPAQARDVIQTFERDGFVKRIPAKSHTDLARVAAGELGADWVIPGTPQELWWPRGESIKDVLAVIPPRYGVVQALIRTFVDASEPSRGASFASRTVRTSLLGPNGADGAPPERLLRPVYRATPGMSIDDRDWTLSGRRVPLRAWYPIEVFRYPSGDSMGSEQIEAGLADGSLVVDTRGRDALSGELSSLPVPTIVDDAAHAVECAAVGEVDLVRVDNEIRALELRIAELEARFWPSVRRSLKRLARRPG